ncbi:MAG TPA: hypothetical protein VLM40_00935, partial [Gemmata sp.]|nr:hypothetical protein [Gemmata sp.]
PISRTALGLQRLHAAVFDLTPTLGLCELPRRGITPGRCAEGVCSMRKLLRRGLDYALMFAFFALACAGCSKLAGATGGLVK